MKINLLKIILVFMLAAIAVEVGIYIFLFGRKNLQTNNQAQSQVLTSNKYDDTWFPPVELVPKDETADQAIKDATLWRMFYELRRIKKGTIQSAVITTQLAGTILEANYNETTLQSFDFENNKPIDEKFQASLKIIGENDQINTLYMQEEALRENEFFKKENETLTPISYKDIKKGDNIIINRIIDITKGTFESNFQVILQ